MGNLTDNKDVNNTLMRKANAIYDEISAISPTLDRITLDDDKFNAWRNMTPDNLRNRILLPRSSEKDISTFLREIKREMRGQGYYEY